MTAPFVPAALRPCRCGRAVPTRHYDAGVVAGVTLRAWVCDQCAAKHGWAAYDQSLPRDPKEPALPAPTQLDLLAALAPDAPPACPRCGGPNPRPYQVGRAGHWQDVVCCEGCARILRAVPRPPSLPPAPGEEATPAEVRT